MTKPIDYGLHSALAIGVAALVVTYALVLVARRLQRRYDGLTLMLPLAVGLAVRFATVGGVDGTGLSERLRGGDEQTFMENAAGLANLPWTDSHWLTTALQDLYNVVFAVQMKLGDFTPAAMRMTQIGIAVLGLLLLSAAVYELAGPAAARVAAWVLMLEPAGIFFDSVLHKEPLMVLASGVTVYGAVRVWRHMEVRGLAIAAAGCAIAIMTRSYAGWFLVAACVVLVAHTALRRMDRPLRAMPLVYIVVLGTFLAWPALLAQSSPEKLQRLQTSQDYNAEGAFRSSPSIANRAYNANNLAFERVDYSTRWKIVTNLPRRVRDVLFRPYPWQMANASQTLGAVGSLVGLGALLLFASYAWRNRGRFLAVTAPLFYPALFLLVAYSLSAGNAGTSFRYRTHIVTLGLAMIVVLWSHARAGVPRAAWRGSTPRRRARPTRRLAQPAT